MSAFTRHPEWYAYIRGSALGAVAFFHLSFLSFSQNGWPVNREERLARIDSLFDEAENQGLNTAGILHYDYYFSDSKRAFLEDFGERLEEDSFEVIGIYEKGKDWQLHVIRNEIHSRESIDDLEKKIRLIKFKYLIDKFDGFSIRKADINPMAVPEEGFVSFIKSLNNSDLYTVAKRLSQIQSHNRALVAWEEAIKRDIYPDTSAFYFGSALVATHDYVDGIESWKNATQLNPSYLDAQMAIANIFYENSHFIEALHRYNKADGLKPNDDVITFHIAETLYQLKRYNESFTFAKKASKLNRDNIYAKNLVKILKRPEIKKLRKQNPDK